MRTLGLIVTLAASGLIAPPALAGDGACADPLCAAKAGCPDPGPCGDPGCCACCGRRVECHPKACQLQCGVAKEKKHVWCVEREEFCPLLPGRRDPCCDRCGEDCCGDCCDHCCKANPLPRCGRAKCVQKLVKKEYEVEKPVYKCVVQYLCEHCCQKQPTLAPKAAPSAPLPPKAPSPAKTVQASDVQPSVLEAPVLNGYVPAPSLTR